MADFFPQWIAEVVGQVRLNDPDDRARFEEGPSTDISSYVSHAVLCRTCLEWSVHGTVAVPVLGVTDWRYTSVAVSGKIECEVLEVPANRLGAPPTAGESVLASAWLSDSKFSPISICADFGGHAILVWRVAAGDRRLKSACALAICGLVERDAGTAVSFSLRRSSQISISTKSRLLESATNLSLLQAALRQPTPGLRFLFLYRLFERSYLAYTLQKLNQTFLDDPRGAVSHADSEIKNERTSLIALVQSVPKCADWFAAIDDEVSRAFGTGNAFIIAIRKSCDDDKWMADREASARGCSIVYKVRCAIVHSASGPVFESFADGEDACRHLLPYLEEALVEYLGISAG